MKKTGLAAIISIPTLVFAVPGDAVAEPVDYVRVCDTYGTGFFYIPGTETCLKISGRVGYQSSWLKNTHSVGAGTVVYGGGGPANEKFGGTFSDWIRRDGVELGFRTSGDYGDLKIGKLPVVGAYLEYEGAWGNEGYQGSSAVGVNGVTGVGFTFYRPDLVYGTGIIANANGFGLDGNGELDNSWHRLNLGLKVSIPGFDEEPGADGGDGLRVRGRVGLFYESLNTDASGSADLTFNGTPFGGYYQNYDLHARDQYFGVRVGTHIGLPPCMDGKLKSGLGADVYLGYHTGEGQYSQQTGVGGGNQVNQTENYSRDGFAVGAGVSAYTSYEFARGWRVGSKVELSYLPQVTSFKAPQNPSEQAAAGFSSESAARVIASFRISRRF
jgi:Porin subfamily